MIMMKKPTCFQNQGDNQPISTDLIEKSIFAMRDHLFGDAQQQYVPVVLFP